MSVNRDNEGRPDVLDTASETQIEELEQQFSEGDRQGWDVLTTSYGWSKEQGTAVWEWFSQGRPTEGDGGFASQ
jgi:hypothetical protein